MRQDGAMLSGAPLVALAMCDPPCGATPGDCLVLTARPDDARAVDGALIARNVDVGAVATGAGDADRIIDRSAVRSPMARIERQS